MSVAHGQRIILAVPEITAATLVGSDSHVGEELLPAPEPAAIVGRHDRHDPLLAGGRATERLAEERVIKYPTTAINIPNAIADSIEHLSLFQCPNKKDTVQVF